MRRVLIALAVAAAAIGVVAGAARDRVVAPIPDEAERGPGYDPGERTLGAAVAIDPLRADAAYRRAFASTFASLTPENAMKWDVVHPSRGAFRWGQADALVAWAQRHGKRVRGHPLVWDQQLPAWLTGRHWTAAELEPVMRSHVRALVERYRGRVESWDVVNEPFEDDGTWSRTLWHEVLGERFVEIAFRAAREVDPNARLFLNEIAAELPGPKQDALVRLARRLQRAGVPIDGVGLQNHTETGEAPTRRQLAAAMERFARLGLDVELTEMDVVVHPPAAPDEQGRIFADAALACHDVARCTGLTVWGVTDATSWLGAAKRPLLFDAVGHPKPALEALRAAWGRSG